jgi:hypothetical protein
VNNRKTAHDGTVYANLEFHEGFMLGDKALRPDGLTGIVTSIIWVADAGTHITVSAKTGVSGSVSIGTYYADDLVNVTEE